MSIILTIHQDQGIAQYNFSIRWILHNHKVKTFRTLPGAHFSSKGLKYWLCSRHDLNIKKKG